MSDRADAPGLTFWGDVDESEALQRYRTLVDIVDDAIYQLDPDGQFVAVNDRLVELTGYTRDELLGATVSLVIDEDDHERIGRHIDARLETGERPQQPFELTVRTADGETIPCELRSSLLIDDGEFRGTVGIVRDVSDRKRAEAIIERRELEQELRERERQLSTLIDNVPGMVYRCRNERGWPMQFVSDACRDITGYEPEALERGDVVWGEDVVVQADRRDLWEAVQREAGDGGTFSETYRIETADGDRRWVRDYGRGVFDDDGDLVDVEGIIEDITEQKRRERELELFRVLLDHSTDSVLVIDPDTGRYLDVNETACRRRGYSRETFLDLTVPDVETGLPDRDAWQSFVDDLRAEGTITFDGRHRRRDGTTYPVEVNASYVELDRGYVLAISRDVTERRARERELERKERRYEAVFEDPNILVGLLEPDGTVLDINGTAMEYIEANLEAVIGEPFWETPWWGESAAVRDDVEEWTARAAAGEYVDFETELTGPDGQRYALSGYFRPVTNDDGEVVSIIVSDRDITQRKTRERTLQRYERILETIDDGVYVLDGDSRFLTVNEAFATMLDRDRESLVGEHASSVFRKPKVDRAERLQRELIEGETDIAELDERVKAADGEIPVVTRLTPFETDDEVGRAGVVRDVSEREERKRELERNKEQLETLFEVLPVGVVVAEADGELVAANDTAHDIWGGDVFDADSVEDYKQYPVWWADSGERVEPEEMPLARVLRGEAVTEPDVFEIDAADGEHRCVEVEGMPIRDDTGEVVRGVVTMSDVTDRRRAQRRLAASERRYRTLVENFPNGAVALFDEDLRYTAAGGAILEGVGVSADEIVGKTLWERYPADLAAQFEPNFRAALDGDPNTLEIEFHDRHWFVHTLPVENDDGDIAAGMVLVQDITERREYQRKLEASNERLEQFAYAVSHDLQEPLRMVTSYLQLLEDRYGEVFDADGEEFLDYAVDGAERMRAMIDALLEYSRVETRGDPLEPTDLNEVVDDVLTDLQLRIEETDAEIATESLPVVDGDADQLRQVFQNLLSNALEYSGDEPPRVSVTAERAGSMWRVSVSDRGIGIDPEEQDRIFEVFQRLHTHEEHAGTGVGLALCERIVERHGGDIRVDSEPGAGTTFSVTLPAASGRET
ncbi:PAS domain S-box protein [Natrinema salaciae]|uniref:histidine kinase n=1 Tax=Natrinema salaciae TaxID=1186196 RepID=A0A1H9LZ82_9EURY|nr:PAS domain S-box protein [Natrinema salaciae]SER16704.1 PAS domain S-box-containing protein [Natrinema salaciae]